MSTCPLPQRLAAEAAGTAVLVATVVGSGIMAERLTQDTALALLANTLPTAAILVLLATLLGGISGAHFNPAVSLVFILRRELPVRDGWLYVACQLAGGLAGVAAAHLMFDLAPLAAASKVRSGPSQWLSEWVATFGLVATILIALRQRPGQVPTLVGLYIGAAYWFTASTSFANPAVTFARAFTDSFSGIRPWDAPAFILAQVLGAACALPAVDWLTRQAPEPYPQEETP